MCAVPTHFTISEIRKAYRFVLKAASRGRLVGGNVVGNPFVTYKELAAVVGYTIDDEYDGDRVGALAGEVSQISFNDDGVMLSALVVSQEFRRPGKGFYTFAQELGLLPAGFQPDPEGAREDAFWISHVTQVIRIYGHKPRRPRSVHRRP
jgi:hypothetical protein